MKVLENKVKYIKKRAQLSSLLSKYKISFYFFPNKPPSKPPNSPPPEDFC